MGLPLDLPWTRYWARLGSEIGVDEPGFLPELDPGWLEPVPSFPVPLSNLRDIPVLILWGESGMGKSDALAREHEDYCRYQGAHWNSRLVDLAAFGNEQSLRQRIIELLAPSDDRRQRVVHFDSFDECHIDIGHLPKIFAESFEQMALPPEAIQLRFACRSAEWPGTLTEMLRRIWGHDNVEIRTLCQLRASDVKQAAAEAGIDPDAFLQAVAARDIESLASRPKTLDYLLGEYALSGDLPRQRWPLFEGGIHRLCQESAAREDHRRGGSLTARERMVIAARMAAVALFSNRTRLRVPGTDAHVAAEALDIESVCGQDPGPGEIQVSLAAVRETLRIGGLFGSDEGGVVDFRHRSDAEFLAAWYLRHLDTPVHVNQILVRDPEGGWLPPQLAGVAAWMAEYDRDIRAWLIEEYPIQFLASDVELDDETRRALIDALMQQVRAGAEASFIPFHRLSRLSHPQLAEQVRTLIGERSAHLSTRYLAFDLVHACNLGTEFVEEANRVLDDEDEFEGPRARAAQLLADVAENGVDAAVAALRPLVLEAQPTDVGERLKSIALTALWPDHLRAEELFPALGPRGSRGVLSDFLLFPQRLATTLRTEHLPVALAWVASLDSVATQEDPVIRDTIDVVMRHAWANIQAPGIAAPFAEAVQASFARHESLFSRRGGIEHADHVYLQDTRKRRLLIEALLFHAGDSTELTVVGLQLVQEQDIPWLIEGMSSVSAVQQEMRAQLVELAFRFSQDPAIVSLVLDHGGPHALSPIPALQQALAPRLEVVPVVGEQADRGRELIRERKQFEAERARRADRPNRRALIDEAFTVLATDLPEGWVKLLIALARESESGRDRPPGYTIIATPGWADLSPHEHDRVFKEAEAYLAGHQPSRDFFDGGDRWTYSDSAAYAAWDLLIGAGRTASLQCELVARWRPLLVSYPFFDRDRPERRTQVLAWLQSVDPDALVRDFVRLVRMEAANEIPAFHRVREFEDIWSAELANALGHEVTDGNLPDALVDEAARWLLARSDQHIQTWLLDKLRNCSDPGRRARAAAVLLSAAPGSAWEALHGLLSSDSKIAKTVLGQAAYALRSDASALHELDESQLSELYLLMEDTYPRAEERDFFGGTYTPDTRDFVADLKRVVLKRLQQSGTQASLEALDRIVSALPEQEWLQRVHRQAEETVRETTWHPPAPSDLIKLLSDVTRHIVRSDAELAVAVEESLVRLDRRLHGETPMAPFLWNEDADGQLKGEERLSDFIKDHLRMDLKERGIIINREVQIRNLKEHGIGERTDLLIQSIDTDKNVRSVVIEVKGDWNPGLDSSMSDQLADRYLDGTDYSTGLYVVGWSGTRPRKCPSSNELLERLREQARNLSINGRTIRAVVLDIHWPPV